MFNGFNKPPSVCFHASREKAQKTLASIFETLSKARKKRNAGKSENGGVHCATKYATKWLSW